MDRIIHWNDRLEQYFVETGERANGLSILHKKSESLYGFRNNCINLPVIALGTINGATSIGSSVLFGDSSFASIGVGLVALGTALLSTINSYFNWGKKAEGHRISSLSYGKLFRFLHVELSLPREERMTADDLLKYVKAEFDRLAEVSPIIPDYIIDKNREMFEKYKGVALPIEMNGLEKIEVCVSATATCVSATATCVSPASARLDVPSKATRTETYADTLQTHNDPFAFLN